MVPPSGASYKAIPHYIVPVLDMRHLLTPPQFR
jgi:hypothetical protein